MNGKLLFYLSKKPELYQPSTSKFWDDEHISKGMLEAHLNPDMEAATRKLDFVRKSADWITALANPIRRPMLLDLGCGPGIYDELFAENGFQVTGMDISTRSLNYARESASRKGLNIEYQYKNYLELDYDARFDVITLIYCDFGVLNPENRNKLLSKIYKALKPDGLFIFDAWTPKFYEKLPESQNWEYSNGGFWSEHPYANIRSFYRFDEVNTFADQYVIVEKDNIECYNIWNHAFTLEEMQADLKCAGFKDTDFYGDVAGEVYRNDSKIICAAAKKNNKLNNLPEQSRSLHVKAYCDFLRKHLMLFS